MPKDESKTQFPYGTEKKYSSSVPGSWKQSGKSVDKKKTDEVKLSKSWKNQEEASRWNSFIDEHNCAITELPKQKLLPVSDVGRVNSSDSNQSSLSTKKIIVDSKNPI